MATNNQLARRRLDPLKAARKAQAIAERAGEKSTRVAIAGIGLPLAGGWGFLKGAGAAIRDTYVQLFPAAEDDIVAEDAVGAE